MSFADAFLSEFEHEMKTTRAMLERVPFENATWKPHEKSRAMSALASHIVGLPALGSAIASLPELDPAAPGMPPRPEYKSSEELLSAFDTNVVGAREAIGKLSDEDFETQWTFKRGGQVMISAPRGRALRAMLMSHLIHHRGQLSVYLRLNDVPLPAVYGPTADT